MISSKDNTWETPWRFFNELDKEFHFTLDPCAQDETAKCKNYYTVETNGLDKDWSNDVVFMNPPYGGHTRDWIEKALQESRKGAKVVCLIVSSSDRSYWHDFIFPYASEIRFIRGRIKFGGSKSTAPFASALVIFNGEKERECNIVYYNKSINKRWGEEDKQQTLSNTKENNRPKKTLRNLSDNKLLDTLDTPRGSQIKDNKKCYNNVITKEKTQ